VLKRESLKKFREEREADYEISCQKWAHEPEGPGTRKIEYGPRTMGIAQTKTPN